MGGMLAYSTRQLSLIPGITKETHGFEWSRVYKAEPSGRDVEFMEEMMIAWAGADRSRACFGSRTIRPVICASVVCGWVGEIKEGVSNASSARLVELGDWRDETASPEPQTDVRQCPEVLLCSKQVAHSPSQVFRTFYF